MSMGKMGLFQCNLDTRAELSVLEAFLTLIRSLLTDDWQRLSAGTD